MSRTRKLLFALTAVFITVTVGILLFEGVWALSTGRSFLRSSAGGGRTLMESMYLDDEERRATALLTEGDYAASRDPWIGIEMKSGFKGDFAGADYETTALGLRRRIGPEPEAGAPSILVLGDSVAFGWGLADDQTLAQRLEAELARATEEGGPRPWVRTAATPGWTVANERQWLLDNWNDVEPDIVIQVVVGNDLDDSFSVLENGLRSVDHDPAVGAERRPHTSYQYNLALAMGLRAENRIGGLLDLKQMPTFALYAGTTPESKRRWNRLLDDLEDTEARVRDVGGRHLTVTLDFSTPFDRG
ncbi:MAG: hypothetical protein KDB53_06965, partial [Planctomycetes bacterium]|nr:hypothetical protein [Planctomycetota bacterium]